LNLKTKKKAILKPINPHSQGEDFFITNNLKSVPMGTIHLEIRDAEGGTDAKLLVKEMLDIYTKAARLNNLECSLVEERNGFAHLCL
jgi:hypothetical protein